jgi:hypothetical protein
MSNLDTPDYITKQYISSQLASIACCLTNKATRIVDKISIGQSCESELIDLNFNTAITDILNCYVTDLSIIKDIIEYYNNFDDTLCKSGLSLQSIKNGTITVTHEVNGEQVLYHTYSIGASGFYQYIFNNWLTDFNNDATEGVIASVSYLTANCIDFNIIGLLNPVISVELYNDDSELYWDESTTNSSTVESTIIEGTQYANQNEANCLTIDQVFDLLEKLRLYCKNSTTSINTTGYLPSTKYPENGTSSGRPSGNTNTNTTNEYFGINLGNTGNGVFKQLIDNVFQFRRLVAGDNITLTQDADTITITGESGGGGSGVSQIVAGTNVTISPLEGTGIVTINSTGGSGGVSPLADVLDEGNTSGPNNIEFDEDYGIKFFNQARLREGTTNAGLGGAKGVALVCSLDYELKWEAGRLYVMDQTGSFIRQSLYNYNIQPTATDDVTKGYMVGSLWTLDDGTIYVCTDITEDNAVWQESGQSKFIEISLADIIDLEADGNLILNVWYKIIDASGGSKKILVTALGTDELSTIAINLSTNEFGEYIASTDTFTPISGGGGSITGLGAGTNIHIDDTDPAVPIINSLSDRYKTTSTTSNSVTNGSKTFTVDANLSYIPEQEVLIVFNASNHMHGTVTSYNSTTGQLIVNVKSNSGSGTYTSWVINLDGTPVDAITGVGVTNRLAYFTAGQIIDDVAAITANRVLISDANGLPTHSSITDTTLSFLDASSSIQTQLNGKQGTITLTTTGTSGAATLSGGTLNIPQYSGGSSALSFNRQADSYTLVLGDAGKVIEMSKGTANTLTIPTNSVAIPIGSVVHVIQRGAGQVTINGPGVTLNSTATWLKLAAQYSAVTLLKVGDNEWYVFGQLAP